MSQTSVDVCKDDVSNSYPERNDSYILPSNYFPCKSSHTWKEYLYDIKKNVYFWKSSNLIDFVCEMTSFPFVEIYCVIHVWYNPASTLWYICAGRSHLGRKCDGHGYNLWSENAGGVMTSWGGSLHQ